MDVLMWSSLILDNAIRITFFGIGIAIIYSALKPSKQVTKTTRYSVSVNAPNLTKEETEQLGKRVIKEMRKNAK